MYIQTGTAEILYDEDVALARGMREEGVDVRLREVGFVVTSMRKSANFERRRRSRGKSMQPSCSSGKRRCVRRRRIFPSFGSRSRRMRGTARNG